MKWLTGILLTCVLALLLSCSAMKADPQREAQADQALRHTAAGNVEAVTALLAPSVDPKAVPASVEQMHALLPKAAMPPGRSLSWTHTNGTGGESYRLVREYDYPAHVVASETIMVKVDGRWLVHGFHIKVVSDAELKTVEFSLRDKSPLHYGVFAAIIIVPVLIVVTVGFALYRRRWGWALFSLFGVTALQLNWATGAWVISPIHFLLLGAGFMKAGGAFAPWIFSVAFPLGAVLFWALGKNRPKPPRVKNTKASPEPAAETASEPDDFTPVSQQ